MKAKKIMVGMLAVGVLMGSGYGIYDLAGKSIIAKSIRPNVVYAEKSQEVTNVDLKDEAVKALQKYFKETPDFDKLKFNTSTETKEDKMEAFNRLIDVKKKMLEGLKEIDLNNIEKPSEKFDKNEKDEDKLIKNLNLMRFYSIKENQGIEEAKKVLENNINNNEESIKRFEKMKEGIKYGHIYLNWESEDGYWSVKFDDKTKEILSAGYEIKDGSGSVDAESFISIEEAKNAAEKFLENNKLNGIKDLKLVKQEEFQGHMNGLTSGFDHDSAAFFYEDENDTNKKVNVVVDRSTGEVIKFDLGKAAEGVTYQTSPY
ncbi:hypothetical protein [Maledivibacter halophilus]|uniref:Peptidase propeptide and YPEB domain-containing protein n=1 Tax=Maledivibacter halophilus TaxID=36842 RepID=A0A1T5KPS3_9FIRM|nr:hypothetical protein [Maledivibacter halophilus]SKC65663.1 hypothetical protein SAMN02194393_02025 [Maledivibacter halophilus]